MSIGLYEVDVSLPNGEIVTYTDIPAHSPSQATTLAITQAEKDWKAENPEWEPEAEKES